MPLNYNLSEQPDYRQYLHQDSEMSEANIHGEGYSYIDNLVSKFTEAIKLYKESTESEGAPWVLFVCEDDERNMSDQKVIEVNL